MNRGHYQGLHISVEGVPGSGKTKVLAILNEIYEVQILDELHPIIEYEARTNLIDRYNNGDAGAAMQWILTQTNNFARRINNVNKQIIIEKNSLTCMKETHLRLCADRKEISDLDCSIIRGICNTLSGNLINEPEVIIFVNGDPRIARARHMDIRYPGNNPISEERIMRLHSYYTDWLKQRGTYQTPVYEINGLLDDMTLRQEVYSTYSRIRGKYDF